MDIFIQLHSVLRWLLLVVFVITIYRAWSGMQQQKSFMKADNQAGLMLIIICDTQLIIGLILYFMGSCGIKNIQNMGMAAVMKDSYSRFFAMEHILLMLIAIILVHIGRAKSKKAITDAGKHKKAFWFYLISFLIILISIPWPFRNMFARIGWM